MLSVKFDRDAIFHQDIARPQNSEKFHLRNTQGNFVHVPSWLFDNQYFQQFVAQGSAVIAEVKSKAVKKPPSAEPSETLPMNAPHARGGFAGLEEKAGATEAKGESDGPEAKPGKGKKNVRVQHPAGEKGD